MSDESAIIVRDDAKLEVAFTTQAVALKTSALESAALIGRVSNAEENEAAVKAQIELKGVLSLVEKARKSAKEPVLDFGRTIDAAAKKFVQELADEMTRISMMAGSFQQLQQAKARAEEQARNERLAELERERAKETAKAKSHEEIDAIAEHFNRKAAATPTISEPIRSEGQRITQDWEITVSDIHALYRSHPNCVDLKPRISEIKELLKMGMTIRGVIAKPITKASVRVSQPSAIDV